LNKKARDGACEITEDKNMMMPETRKIAAIAGDDGAKAQTLLTEMAAEWRAGGAKIAGVIAEGNGLPGRTCGAGFLREIASGKAHTIYLGVPSSDTTCHLDAAAVADAGTAIIAQIPNSDLVVLNKFGKLEATGKGLAAAFAAAIAADEPLLTTVSAKHRDAWSKFAPRAILLCAEKTALQDWWDRVRTRGPRQEGQALLGASRLSARL
jgi:nucleoside-triphosphatase THEP1